jgi:hypothetical protein
MSHFTPTERNNRPLLNTDSPSKSYTLLELKEENQGIVSQLDLRFSLKVHTLVRSLYNLRTPITNYDTPDSPQSPILSLILTTI